MLIATTAGIYLLAVVFIFLYKPQHYHPFSEQSHHKIIHLIPNKISFAEEMVLFPTPTAYQLFYAEFKINARMKSSTYKFRLRARKILPTIEYILKKNNIPDDFKYIAIAESYLKNDVTSPQGAKGIWQFTESTALSFGLVVNENIDERLDLIKSTKAACRLIKMARSKFGSWTLAAAAYNRGIGGMERAINKQENDSYYHLKLNKETARYLYKLVAIKLLFES